METLATSQDLRAALEKGTDELKLDTLRRIIISTLNGSPHVSSAGTCLGGHTEEKNERTDQGGCHDALAYTPYAYHSIRLTIQKQAYQEVITVRDPFVQLARA